MSNYRVRQVLALPKMPENQLRLLLALATYLNDDSRSVRVGFNSLVRDAGNVRNTVRTARRELEAGGKLVSQGGGRGPRDVPLWTVLCLPEKGVSDVDPLSDDSKGGSDVDPLTKSKRVKRSGLRGSTDPEKGGQPESADQRESDAVLNRRANSQCFLSPRARDAVLGAVPDATEREIADLAAQIEETHAPGNLGAYVAAFPSGQIAEAIARMRQGFTPLRLTRQEQTDAAFAAATDLAHAVTSTETRAAALLLAAVDPDVTEDEAAEALEILRQRGALQPVAVLETEIANGNGYKLLGEARHRINRQAAAQWDGGVLLTPTAPAPQPHPALLVADEPEQVRPIDVACPDCGAEPLAYCRRSGWCAGRRKAAAEKRAQAAAS